MPPGDEAAGAAGASRGGTGVARGASQADALAFPSFPLRLHRGGLVPRVAQREQTDTGPRARPLPPPEPLRQPRDRLRPLSHYPQDAPSRTPFRGSSVLRQGRGDVHATSRSRHFGPAKLAARPLAWLAAGRSGSALAPL